MGRAGAAGVQLVARAVPLVIVILPIAATVPIWLEVTTTAAPLPAAPALAWVRLTFEPDWLAVKSVGAETNALSAVVIWPATALAVDPPATLIGPEITDTPPIVMSVIDPPAALMVPIAM